MLTSSQVVLEILTYFEARVVLCLILNFGGHFELICSYKVCSYKKSVLVFICIELQGSLKNGIWIQKNVSKSKFHLDMRL